MTTTVLGTYVAFNNGSQQNTGTYVNLDSNTGAPGTSVQTSYAIGHYLLIENNSYGSYSVAVPLNGWDSSTYSSPVIINGVTFTTETFGGSQSYTQNINGSNFTFSRSNVNLGSNAYQAVGTWRNRGGNLSVFLVQRVA